LTRPGRAWAALAGVLVGASVAALALDPAALARLDWRPALAGAEPWRAWTAALVHGSGAHLAANAAGGLLVGAYGWVARVPPRAALAWAVAWPATQAALAWLAPGLPRYVGLSGVLHAGLAVAALHLALAARGRVRTVGAATLAVVVAKVALEAPWGPLLRPSEALGIQVAPVAHAAGLLAGTLAALVADAFGRRAGPGAPAPPGRSA
jgi:rhomboid family GlyGly-CTERM serine protease